MSKPKWYNWAFPITNIGRAGELTKGKEGATVTAEPMMPEWQLQTGKDLSEWARKYLALFAPGAAYPGEFPAGGSTGFEQMGLETLGNYLTGPDTGDLFGAAKSQLMDTLGGKYADPTTSPFIQSMTGLAKQNLQDAITQARGQRGARGTYFTRSALQEESRLSERTQNALNAMIGEFLNTERGRQFEAAPMAQQLESYAAGIPMKKVAASQAYGGLERTLGIADFERRYSDFQRQRNELGTTPGVAAQVYGTNVPYGLKSVQMPGEPSALSSILQAVSGINFNSLFGGQGSGTGGKASTGDWMNTIAKLLPVVLAAV